MGFFVERFLGVLIVERQMRGIRFSGQEWERVRSAADGESPSAFIRRVVLEECARVEGERRRAGAEAADRQRLIDVAHGNF